MPQYFKNHGERLLELGYPIVPLPQGSKGPRHKGWQHLDLNVETFRKMAANGSADAGAGILAARVPAIDVDILDEDVAEQMSQVLEGIFGTDLLARVGQAPKFLVPFRTSEPFTKLSSNRYTDGTNDHRIEILGDGQQWVAFHTHPSTGKPYYWGGGRSILDVRWSDLPELTLADAQRVIDAFEVLAAARVESGHWHLRATRLVERDSVPRGQAPESDPFAAHAAPVTDLTRSQIEALVHKCDHTDYEEWIDAGMRLHHQYEGSHEGFEIWDAWSSNSHKYDTEVMRPHWDSFGHRTDAPKTIRGLIERHGQPAAPEHKPRADGSKNPFAVHEWSDYKQNYLSTPWIVKGVLPQAEVGILYGQSGSGKTFFVLDMAACIARGADWRGRKVSDCRVVYVAAEAREGIKKRMDAYDQHVSADGRRPDIIACAPNLLSTDTKQLIEAIGSAGLIILDTMAASHSGDENSARDMGLFLAACKDISHATGAMVLAVHHTGKEDSKGMRGSSALFAGADFVMEIFKNKVGDRFEHGAMLSKSRDDVTGTSFGFELKRVTVGVDDEGDDVTTCVIEPVQKEVSKTPKRPRKLANLEDSRYDMHREILTIFERITDESPTRVVTDDQLLEAIIKKFPSKLRRNMVPLVLRLEEFGVIRRTEAGLSLADDDLDAC
jgi:hypothetical protein